MRRLTIVPRRSCRTPAAAPASSAKSASRATCRGTPPRQARAASRAHRHQTAARSGRLPPAPSARSRSCRRRSTRRRSIRRSTRSRSVSFHATACAGSAASTIVQRAAGDVSSRASRTNCVSTSGPACPASSTSSTVRHLLQPILGNAVGDLPPQPRHRRHPPPATRRVRPPICHDSSRAAMPSRIDQRDRSPLPSQVAARPPAARATCRRPPRPTARPAAAGLRPDNRSARALR